MRQRRLMETGFCLNALRIIAGPHSAASSQFAAQQQPQYSGSHGKASERQKFEFLLDILAVAADYLYLYFHCRWLTLLQCGCSYF